MVVTAALGLYCTCLTTPEERKVFIPYTSSKSAKETAEKGDTHL
jgi:hypothetical protein